VTIPIRLLADHEHDEVLAVTARAFWHDPLFDFFTRDLLHEYRLLPTVFRAYLGDLHGPASQIWVADLNGRPRGVVGWVGPGGYPRSALHETRHSARAAMIVARVRHRSKAARLLLDVDRRHPRERHWYLALLATDPTAQGRGIGSALLAPILQRCDRDEMLAYTETQKEANVSWYARAGFAVTDEIRLPGTPPVWCLQRHPATPPTRGAAGGA
jgi:ribosomal protein S18 acetylase RimI-like enzyme